MSVRGRDGFAWGEAWRTGSHGMTTGGSSGGPAADLATMLADMDTRLQALQRELEEVAVPITRRGVQPPPRGVRAVLDPTGEVRAQPDLDEVPDPAAAEPTVPAPVAETGGRPVARPRRSRSVAPAASSAQASLEADQQPAAPKRARRVTTVQAVPAEALAPAASVPPPSPPPSGTPRSASPATARRAAGPESGPAAGSGAADSRVRETILQAEEEARLVVEDARERIGAIGARTRAAARAVAGRCDPPARPPGQAADHNRFAGR